MDRYSYVALFEHNTNDSYTVTFPDLPGCITEGDSFHDAQLMAKEALELHLYGMEEDNDPLPVPTSPNEYLESGKLVSLIEANMLLTRMEMDNKRIAKNCSLPRWLIKAAEAQKVNFSTLLESALYQELGIEHFVKENTK